MLAPDGARVLSELSLLRALLLASMALGPLATRGLFPARSRLRDAAHLGALACAAAGMLAPAPALTVVWLLFCAGSFAGYLHARAAALRSPAALATCVPFVFSNIAATWLVGGTNELHLLGYGVHFSYYAALHGNVLGWLVLGTVATLADPPGPHRRLYLATILVALASFLLIAFGIDQLRALKPIGVVGLSVVLPGAQLVFLRGAWSRSRPGFVLGVISLTTLALTMALAWQNELALPVLQAIPGIRGMVSVHGLLNTLVVAPCFLLAAGLDARARRDQARAAATGPTSRGAA